MHDVTLVLVNGVLPVAHGDASMQTLIDPGDNPKSPTKFGIGIEWGTKFSLLKPNELNFTNPENIPPPPTKFAYGIMGGENVVMLQINQLNIFNPENLPTQPSK